MSEFDPYHRWLGVAPGVRPPDHYQLLGIPFLEADADVIASAADRQMAHVRSLQAGAYATLTQQLLNELAAARLCLLNPDRKREYDERLRQARTMAGGALSAAVPAPVSVPPPRTSAPPPIPIAQPVVAAPTSAPFHVVKARRARPAGIPLPLLAAGVVGLVGAAIVAMIWSAIGTGPPTGTIILNVTPPDRADLRLDIDGRQQAVTSGGETRLTIPAGAHVVRVTCPAYVGFEQRIDVAADQTTAVRVQLRPVARVTITLPHDRPANLRISFNGRAQPLPSGVTLVVPCNPGTHVVRATSDQGDFEHSVTVVENQNRLVTIPNRDDKRLTGRWIGAVEVDAQAVERKLKDSQANALQRLVTQGLVAGLATGRLEIELQPDGVYRAQVQLGPLSSQSAGQWTILESAPTHVTVELKPQSGPIDQRRLTFIDENTFTTDLPGEAKDFGRFRCRRDEPRSR